MISTPMKAAQTARPRRQRTCSFRMKIERIVTRLGMRKSSAKASAKGRLRNAITLSGVVAAIRNTLSPMSQGLFQRTISISRSPGFMKTGESRKGMR